MQLTRDEPVLCSENGEFPRDQLVNQYPNQILLVCAKILFCTRWKLNSNKIIYKWFNKIKTFQKILLLWCVARCVGKCNLSCNWTNVTFRVLICDLKLGFPEDSPSLKEKLTFINTLFLRTLCRFRLFLLLLSEGTSHDQRTSGTLWKDEMKEQMSLVFTSVLFKAV